MLLLESLRLGGQRLLGALRASALLFVVALAANIQIAAAIMTRLVDADGESPRKAFGIFSAHFLPFLMLAGIASLARVSSLLLALLFGTVLHDALGPLLGERVADTALLLAFVLGWIVIALIGFLQDVSRAVVVHRRCSGWSALALGLQVVSSAPGRLLGAWVQCCVWSFAILATALAVGSILSSGDAGHAAWTLHVGLLQPAVFAMVGFRVWWLVQALRTVANRTAAGHAPRRRP